MRKNAFVARAVPRTLLGELTVLSQTQLAGFQEGNMVGEMETARGERKWKWKKRKVRVKQKGEGNGSGGVCVIGFMGDRRPCIWV